MGNSSSSGSDSRFTQKALDELKKEFSRVDSSKTGELNSSRFRELAERIGIAAAVPKADQGKLFRAFDADGNGTVSFMEVASSLAVLCTGTPEEKLGYLFTVYDTSKSGVIDRDELAILIRRMHETAVTLGRSDAQADALVDAILSKLDPRETGSVSRGTWIDVGKEIPELLGLMNQTAE